MLQLTWSHGRLLEQLVEMGALIRPQAASVFAAEVQKLQQDLDQIKELLKDSWWETRGTLVFFDVIFGSLQRSRGTLKAPTTS